MTHGLAGLRHSPMKPRGGNSMPGTICVVIGPNGYGKTTYLNDTSKELANAGCIRYDKTRHIAT